jgi:hypothetical protein
MSQEEVQVFETAAMLAVLQIWYANLEPCANSVVLLDHSLCLRHGVRIRR